MSSPRIPYGRQWIDDDDVAALTEAARADFLTQGPRVEAFERAIAEYVGAPYAVVCSSGTAALHLAALAAGVGPGDLSITSPLTFVASMNGALYCGGRPDFGDIDPITRNLSPSSLEAAIARSGRPKQIVAVHYAGLPADLPAISRIARESGAVLVEDASHAIGAEYQDPSGPEPSRWHRVGACDHSDMTVFSFHPVKHVTTAEGGAITTRSEELYQRLCRLRTHGITRDPARLRAPESERGLWYNEMQELGFNYRIPDLQCALGLSQMRRLPAFLERRRAIAARYREALADLSDMADMADVAGVELPAEPAHTRHAYHLFPLWLDEERLGRSRRAIFDAMQARGLGVQVHYLPVHLHPYYRDRFGTHAGQFPVAERFYRGAISIPMYPAMQDADVERVITIVRETTAVTT